MGLFNSIFDPGNVFGGEEGGISASGVFDPAGTILDSAGLAPQFYTNTTDKLDDWAGDLAAFEGSHLQDMWGHFRKNPVGSLVAGTPISTKVWNTVLNKDWEPQVNQLGGPTEQNYQRAEQRGVDTSNARGSHQVAGAIASFYGGGALGNAFGAAGQGMGIGAAGGQALGGAAVGAGNAWANDQNVWKGAMQGGLGGYLSNYNYGGAVGLNDPMYLKMFNGAVGGGLTSGLSGDNVGQGALLGAGKGAASTVGDMYFNDAPNEGTLGGTQRDEYGENTTTGYNTPQQQDYNNQAQGLSNTYGTPQGFSKAASMGSDSPAPQGESSPYVDALVNALSSTGSKLNVNNVSNFASQLAGLYDAHQQRKRVKEQIGSLNSLYSPNSPYAQQMRQRMERQDAASGRRSQYGVRETELAAKLADSQARLAPQINQLYGQDSAQRNRMLSNGLRIGQGLYNLYGN